MLIKRLLDSLETAANDYDDHLMSDEDEDLAIYLNESEREPSDTPGNLVDTNSIALCASFEFSEKPSFSLMHYIQDSSKQNMNRMANR